MTFSIEDCEQTCLLKDGKVGTIIQVSALDVMAQVFGEPDARYITWDKFERVNGVAVQVRE